MQTYHKIQTVFLRDPVTKYKTLLMGEYAKLEFDYLKSNPWLFEEKVNGTNIRVIYHYPGYIKVKGKTDRAELNEQLVKKVESYFTPTQFLQTFGKQSVCFYGEGIGPKIQRPNTFTEYDFILFDIKVGKMFLTRQDVVAFADTWGIQKAPTIGVGTLPDMVQIVKNGFKSKLGRGDFMAEGLIARPLYELRSRMRERIITKLKYKDF